MQHDEETQGGKRPIPPLHHRVRSVSRSIISFQVNFSFRSAHRPCNEQQGLFAHATLLNEMEVNDIDTDTPPRSPRVEIRIRFRPSCI